MTAIQYMAIVKEGLLLELPAEAQTLHLRPGDSVQIMIEHDTVPMQTAYNEKAAAVLRGIVQRQEGHPYTDNSDTLHLLQEARSGAMYNNDDSK